MLVKEISDVSGLSLQMQNNEVSLKLKNQYSDDYRKEELVEILKMFIEFMEKN